MQISQRAFDLIINEETGGRAYYDKRERFPDWPGGASGVTFGIGYDCGYATVEEIHSDWDAVLNTRMLAMLEGVAGIKGSPAKCVAHELAHQGFAVEWEQALQVFDRVDLPKWTSNVLRLPGAQQLPPDCLGALVSLAFNRGMSFNTPEALDPHNRYVEMRQIKADLAAGHYLLIPDLIRSMKRLWPSSRDLRDRRDHEAALFEEGLKIVALPSKPAAEPATQA